MTRPAKLGRPRPVQTIGGILGGSSNGSGGSGNGTPEIPAPSGQVPTSNGSNGVAWASNVGSLFADGQPVIGPFVNIAAGSNVTLTRDAGPGGSFPSNTIRIHASAGASSPLTTKGDLYTFSTVNDRLAVGSNGTAPIADSGESVGIRWTTQAIAGELLISSTHSVPVVFDDMLQTSTGDDFVYGSL